MLAALLAFGAQAQPAPHGEVTNTEDDLTVRTLKDSGLNLLFRDGSAYITEATSIKSAAAIVACRAELKKLQDLFPTAPLWVPWLAGGVSVAVGVAVGILVGFFALPQPKGTGP